MVAFCVSIEFSLRERLPSSLLALDHVAVLSFELSLDLLGAEPEISQLGGAVLLQLCIALAGVLLQTLVVCNDLRDASVLDLVEQRHGRGSATGEFGLVLFAGSRVLLVGKDATLECVYPPESWMFVMEKVKNTVRTSCNE